MNNLEQVDNPSRGANIKAHLMQEWQFGKVVDKNLDGSVTIEFVGMGLQSVNPRDTALYKSSCKEHEKALDLHYKKLVSGGKTQFPRRRHAGRG